MLPQIKNWLMYYAKPGYPDQRAMQDFVEVESHETVRMIQAELVGIKNSSYDHYTLETILGRKRFVKHQSYEEWAKTMLVAIADYSNRK